VSHAIGVKRRGRTPAGTPTRLENFIRANDLLPNIVAEVAGVSRQHLLRIRFGQAEPTRPMMVWITMAVRRLSGRRVQVTDLFDLGDVER
jgi:hypothetical protein